MGAEPIIIPSFVSVTLGLLVFLVGMQVTLRVRFLRDFNIPEPVSGGMLVALLTLAVYVVFGQAVSFELGTRDYLLVLFFAAIGLNARFSDLVRGGRPLVILMVMTVLLILLQNVIGVVVAAGFGLPPRAGILLGSVSLIGGHGTAIAWAPEITEATGFAGAAELGIAGATIGLVLAALIGGPVAKFLIERHKLTPDDPDGDLTIGLSFEDEQQATITFVELIRVLFVLHVTIILGYLANAALAGAGVRLPLFVPVLIVAILVGNGLPRLMPNAPPVSHTPTLGLLSDFALGVFLAMSLMSLQLWTLQGMGLMLIVAMLAQFAATVAVLVLAVFPLMGRNFFAAVVAAGYGGFLLGATPTAIANMNAVTKRYGPAPLAFVILPLVSAFFTSFANTLVIQGFLSF